MTKTSTVTPVPTPTPPKSPVLPIHPPDLPPDPEPFVVAERKSGGILQFIVFILALVCLSGGIYILFLKPNAPPVELVKSSPLTSTIDPETQQAALDLANGMNQEFFYQNAQVYTESGLSIAVPNDWVHTVTETPKGQIFATSDKGTVITIHASGTECFPTLEDFISGIKKLGGYDIENSVETQIGYKTIYIVPAKIKAQDGTVLSVVTYLYKGTVNNYEVSVLGDSQNYLVNMILGSVNINEDSSTSKLACS